MNLERAAEEEAQETKSKRLKKMADGKPTELERTAKKKKQKAAVELDFAAGKNRAVLK